MLENGMYVSRRGRSSRCCGLRQCSLCLLRSDSRLDGEFNAGCLDDSEACCGTMLTTVISVLGSGEQILGKINVV